MNPYDKYWTDDEPQARVTTRQVPRRTQQAVRPHQAARVAAARGAGGSFLERAFRAVDDNIRLAADGVTFGYADRWAARLNSWTQGGTYEQRLREEQQRTNEARRRQGVSVAGVDIAPAEIAGSLVAPGAAIARGVRSVKGLAAVGGAEAFVAGTGYSESTDGRQMIADGVRMVPWGMAFGAAGAVVGKGAVKAWNAVKPVRLTPKRPVASEAPRPQPEATPAARPAAQAADEAAPQAKPKVIDQTPEEGALVTPAQLAETPEQAVEIAQRKIAMLSDEEAQALVARIEKAEETGELLDDPHFRSILNVDLSDVATAPEKFARAVNAAEEIYETLRDRVAQRKVSTRSVDAKVRSEIETAFDDDAIAERVARADQSIRDARFAQIMMARAGIEAARARDAFTAAVEAGAEGAVEELKTKLGRALWLYNAGAAIRSKQGRALQIGQEANRMLDDKLDDIWEVDEVEITGRLEEVFRTLDQKQIGQLLARLRTGEDVGEVFDVLMRPERAQAVSMWQRAAGSFEGFLKSNGLTPITAVFNGVSAMLNDTFRNHLGRRYAAYLAGRAGRDMEALGLRLELEAANGAYWQAHLMGLRAMLDRVRFEFWDSVESIAGVGFGSGKARARASASKMALAAKGTFTAEVREMNSMNPKKRLRVNDLDGFNARMDELSGQGGFGAVWAAAQRVGAVGLNTLDALGTASGKLFTGSLDDWGRTFVAFKERYAQAARIAMREAVQLGIEPDKVADYVRRRGKTLAELPTEEMWAKGEEAILRDSRMPQEVRNFLELEARVQSEAERVLFLDGPQTEFGRTTAAGVQWADLKTGMILPYVKTPVRLLEVGIGNYTKLGKFTREGQEILARGGPEAAIYRAQMEMGTTLAAIGFGLGAIGAVVVTNGSFENTANLDGDPPNRLQIGSLFVELGRLDPFATTLGLGAMLGQAAKDGFLDYAQYRDFEQAMNEALLKVGHGLRDAVLSKSYLRGLKEVVDALSDGPTAALEKIAGSVSARMVPLGGTQKLINDTLREDAPDAKSIWEQTYRNILGAGMMLPVKRNILGDPIEGRDLGVAYGVSGDELDDVGRTLKELEIDLTDLRRTDPAGFKLTAAQLNRLREIRGTIAQDKEGRTLREALADLFASEEFELIQSKVARKELVAEVIREFNKPARELLAEEDQDYAAQVYAQGTFQDYLEEGLRLSEAEEKAERDTLGEFGEYIDIE